MLLGLMHSFYTILWVMSKTNPAQTTTSFPRQLWFTLTYVLCTVYKYTKYSAHSLREQEVSCSNILNEQESANVFV